MIFFYIELKKWVVQAHHPPRTVSENYEKKTLLQWKPMDLGGIP